MTEIGRQRRHPLVDLLGLVDPVISKLPGGYTQKIGPGYVARVFDKAPRYMVLIGNRATCERMRFDGQEKLRRDPRFQQKYRLLVGIPTNLNHWCIFERHDAAIGGVATLTNP